MMRSFVMIAIMVLSVAAAFAYAGGWLSPNALTPQRFIEQFEHGGKHEGFRRNHAKGICVSGYFTGNGAAAVWSHAQLFRPGHVPVIGRFSLAGTDPHVPDATAKLGSLALFYKSQKDGTDQADAVTKLRLFALMFKLNNGEEWRTGMTDLPVFPFSTPEAFYDQFLAARADPATGKPDPSRMQAFSKKYPDFARAAAIIRARPLSSGFEDTTYYGLNAFYFVNAKGEKTPVRWSVEPVQPVVPASADAPAPDNDYLFHALQSSLQKQPLQWRLRIVIGQSGDITDNAAVPWPHDRKTVDAGIITLDHIEDQVTGSCRDINFDPLILPSGIEPSDDPILSARSAVYSQSLRKRDSEIKTHIPPVATGVPHG